MKPYARICCSAAILTTTMLASPVAAALEPPDIGVPIYATAPPGGSGMIFEVDETLHIDIPAMAGFSVGDMLAGLYGGPPDDLPAWTQMRLTAHEIVRILAIAEFEESNVGGTLDVVIDSREHDVDRHLFDGDGGSAGQLEGWGGLTIAETMRLDDHYDTIVPAPHIIDLVASPGPKPMRC